MNEWDERVPVNRVIFQVNEYKLPTPFRDFAIIVGVDTRSFYDVSIT